MRQRVTRQSSLPAKLHLSNMNHQEPLEGDNNQFQFPDPSTYYTHSSEDNLDDDNQEHQEHPGWLFSPRSASPQSDAEYQDQV